MPSAEPARIADFTYVWAAEDWLYVAAVIDLFSRRVVGWSMKAEMAAQLVTDVLVTAIWRRGKPDALLHHSGQGSKYASKAFQRLTADNGITCSMKPLRQCLRQCRHGELLLLAEDRADQGQGLPDQGQGTR